MKLISNMFNYKKCSKKKERYFIEIKMKNWVGVRGNYGILQTHFLNKFVILILQIEELCWRCSK